jgi:hypothetical protein
MSAIFTNWKTTVAGGLLIALSILSLFGVSIPGFTSAGLVPSIVSGIGLILSSDASLTASFGKVIAGLSSVSGTTTK